MHEFAGRAMDNVHELRKAVKDIEERASASGDEELHKLALAARDLADAVDEDELLLYRVNADLALGNDKRAFDRLDVPLKKPNPPKKKLRKPADTPPDERTTQEAQAVKVEDES